MMKAGSFFTLLGLAAAFLSAASTGSNAQDASDATRAANDELRAYLPFADESDFEDARRGFVAQIEGGTIIRPDGQISYDAIQFEFLTGDAPATANPSLWRQSSLNAIHGLFEVVPG